MSKTPRVSIITPSFNQGQFIEETVQSVLNQDFDEIEYIVVDGGSSDNTLAILQKYSDRISTIISEPDQGQGDAINKGFRLAQGEIVAWINSDDFYLPGVVRAAVQILDRHPEIGMVYGDGILIDAEGEILDWHHYRTLTSLDLLTFNVLLQPAVFMRRSVLDKAGLLDPSYQLVLDHDLWIRMSAHAQLLHVAQFWAVERTHGAAKTIAAAAGFVAEAGRLIEQSAQNPLLAEEIGSQRRLIDASLDAFAGRRLIDAGEYGPALSHFWSALRHKPAAALKYWYKIVQAGMGFIGLEWLFMAWRNQRRRLQHQHQTIQEYILAQSRSGSNE